MPNKMLDAWSFRALKTGRTQGGLERDLVVIEDEVVTVVLIIVICRRNQPNDDNQME